MKYFGLNGRDVVWHRFFWADVNAENMLVDLRDNMQPHDSIRRSPPLIKVLTHSAYFAVVFTCKYLGTDRFLSWRMCFRKSPLHMCTLLKVGFCVQILICGYPVYIYIYIFSTFILLLLAKNCTVLKDMLLKCSTLIYKH